MCYFGNQIASDCSVSRVNPAALHYGHLTPPGNIEVHANKGTALKMVVREIPHPEMGKNSFEKGVYTGITGIMSLVLQCSFCHGN